MLDSVRLLLYIKAHKCEGSLTVRVSRSLLRTGSSPRGLGQLWSLWLALLRIPELERHSSRLHVCLLATFCNRSHSYIGADLFQRLSEQRLITLLQWATTGCQLASHQTQLLSKHSSIILLISNECLRLYGKISYNMRKYIIPFILGDKREETKLQATRARAYLPPVPWSGLLQTVP